MELKFDKCMECGRQFTGYAGLSKHLPQAHPGITNQEYYDKYYKQPGEGICPVCGNPTQFSGRLNRGYYAHCSKQCTSLDKKVDAKRRATKKELYGSETFNNHDKTTQTKLERYGDANYANGDQIRQTKLDRYGLAGYNNVAKREATKLERFGDANFVNPEKGMATKQAKYGDAHYNNSAKMQETKLDKYGNSSFVNPDKARATVKRKTIEKYNRLIGKQCDVLDYNDYMFHCKCKTCQNEFDIPINTGYMRLYCYGTNWCTVCNPPETARSNEENALFEYVASLVGNENVDKSCRDVIPGIELDIYVPSLKLAIEFDGLYWHDERKKSPTYHVRKTDLCEQNGIQLIHVFEDEWNFNQDVVKSRLSGLMGRNRRIPARKCTVSEISAAQAEQFLMENHIQGSCVSSWRYGLLYNGDIVAVMTFGKNRFGDGIELLRFCNRKYTTVIGGASRLFSRFIQDHLEIDTVLSFADRRWSSVSAFYPKLGFTDDGVTRPSYYYVIANRRHNRMEFTKSNLVQAGFDSSMSEHDIMLSRKIYRIYDCGNRRFIWHRS